MNSKDKPHSPKPDRGETTQLLLRWKGGDLDAREQLIVRIYHELLKLARRQLKNQRPNHPLQTGDLVNEVFVRLIDSAKIKAENRRQFFALAAESMRNILVDWARRQNFKRREGMKTQVSLDEALTVSYNRNRELVALDDALTDMEKLDQRLSKVVELRYFGGYRNEEIAEHLGVSVATVKRDWVIAQSWLFGELKSSRQPPPDEGGCDGSGPMGEDQRDI